MKKNINKNYNEELIENNLIDLSDLIIRLKRRRKIIVLTSTIIFLFSIINLTYKRIARPQYLGTFSIMIRDPIVDRRRENSSAGSGFIENLAINTTYSDIPTLIQYLKSEKVISKTAELNNISPYKLKNQLQIIVPRDINNQGFLPSILEINVVGPDKFKLQKIIENLSKDYLKIASNTKKSKLTDGINFLNNERPSLEERSNKLQDQLENFRLTHKLIDPISEADVMFSRIEEIKNKILSLQSENVRLMFIKDNLMDGILFAEGLYSKSENSGLDVIGSEQLLLQEILDVKSELAKAQSTYKKSSTVVINIQEKLDQLEPILLENQKSAVDAAIMINNGKIKSFKNKLFELEKKFSYLPKLINKYTKILSNQKLVEQNLSNLLEAREKLELDLSQGTLPWKIISKPYVNPRPFKPEIKNNLIYGLIISLTAGIILALIIDKIDDVFHSPQEIEKDNKLPPLLGFIPFFSLPLLEKEKTKPFLTIKDFLNKSNEGESFNFIFEETFRNIYTSIKFSSTDKQIQKIAITSTIPSEGKSLFSILLALNVSEIDKKVLVIDSDLRRPSLHKKLEVDNVIGLSNVLVDKKLNWKDVTYKLKGYPNFSYLTGGKIPPNPLKLLESQNMKDVVKDISNSGLFDLIIFDCAPILGLSDSLIISEYVEGVLLTISLNKVSRQFTKEALQKLNTTSSNIIGVVANNTKEPVKELGIIDNYYKYKYEYQNKYLPIETKDAYLKETNEIKTETLPKEINESFKLKIKNIFINFKNKFTEWINE